MQPPVDSNSSCNAMKNHGIKRLFFDTFFQKKATAQFFPNNYTQSVSENFSSCYFTGKERDEETGYGYFGARYMDYELLTSFLSVDRYASKYPSISPYVYCAWNPIVLTDPSGDTLDVVNKKGQYLFTLDDNSTNRNKITAKNLYNTGIQWFEPNADNYMPLLYVNSNIENINGIDHFTWDDIEKYAFTDRLMVSYRHGGAGDFKSKMAKHFLCTVDGIPYWTDVIGQIPFAINCYKDQLMNGRNHREAAKYTQTIGHLFANGFFGFDEHPNDADNWMIKRVCIWASKAFKVGEIKKCGWYYYYNIERTSYKFKKLAQWKKTSH